MAAKSVGFRLFPGVGVPSPSSLRDATSPEVGGKGCSAASLALPQPSWLSLWESCLRSRLRGLIFPPAALPSPSRLAPCHLPQSGRQGLFRHVLGSHFGRAVAVRRLRGLVFPSARLRGLIFPPIDMPNSGHFAPWRAFLRLSTCAGLDLRWQAKPREDSEHPRSG